MTQKISIHRRGRIYLLFLFVFLGLRETPCATITWSNTATSTDWSLGTNWNGGAAPVAGDDVRVFGRSTGGTFAGSNNSAFTAITLNSLTVLGGGAPDGDQSITLSSTLNVGAGGLNNTMTTGGQFLFLNNVNLAAAQTWSGARSVIVSGSLSGSQMKVDFNSGQALRLDGSSASYSGGFDIRNGFLGMSSRNESTITNYGTGAIRLTNRRADNVTDSSPTFWLAAHSSNTNLATAQTVTNAIELNPVVGSVGNYIIQYPNDSSSNTGVLILSGAITDVASTSGRTLTFNRQNVQTPTFILTGVNSYAANTTIGATTTLQLGNGGTTGNIGSGSISNGGTLVFNRSNAMTLSNNISGTGTLQQTGTGTTTISGTNSYTGTTTISSGTLQFEKAASLYNDTLGSWTAANIKIASGGTLALNVGGTNEFTTGEVTTLLTNLGGANGDASNGFASGSKIAFDTTNALGGTFTVADNIANSSGVGGGAIGLTKLGTGTTLILGGANTYTGETTITAGTLQAGAANAFSSSSAVTLANTAGATLALNNFSNSIASLSGGGTTGGNVTLGSGTLTTGGDNTSTTYAGEISGTGGVTKTGSGTQTLTGTNTATGVLTLNSGTVVIGTSAGGSWAGSVLANSGTTLKGRGTIGGNVTIASGATYGPGNSPGIQSILGNLTLASGSRTEIEIDGATAGNGAGFHDQINVTGTVTIQGGTIAPMTVFSGSSGYSPSAGQRFAAITGSSVTGTFDTIDNTGNAAGLGFIPEYTSNTVFLRTTFSSFANNSALGLTGNQGQIGAQLDRFRPTTIVTGVNATDADRIYGALTLLNNEGVRSAITQMSPEKLSAMPQVAQSIGSQTHGQVNRQLELRRGFQPTQGDLSIYNRNGQTVYEPVAGVLTDTLFLKRKPEKLSFFASVNGEQGEVKPSQQRTDYDYWTATAIYGGNYALSQSVNLGLFTAYGHSNTSLGGAGGEIDYDTGKFGGYLSWSDEGWFVNGTLSGGKSFYKTERRIAFLSETAKGKTEAWEGVGELRAGKDLSYGKWTLSPSIWQRYSQSFIDSYQENGSSARLNIKSMDPKSMVSGAGVSLQRAFAMGEQSLIPRVYANYEREWIRSQEIQGRFAAGGTNFQVSSDPIDADQLTAGAGVTWLLSDQLQWDLSYERETLQNDLQRQAVNLSCKFAF